MIDSIKYRGPDDRGVFFVPISGDRPGIGLAHARLSIIDLTPAGHQPMASQDGRFQIVFNGEIYNFKNLKKLVSDYPFQTKSDTEVILALFEKFGLKTFEKLDGMFALAIYDTKDNKLILARDRFGKKPLYWAHFGDTFLFGSEMKALCIHPEFCKELNMESVHKYLFFEYVPTPHTMFKNVFKLEPASCLVYDGVSIVRHVFWKLDYSERNKDILKKASENLDDLLNRAVSKRLISDRPLGIFLSGGIDSSTIAYYAQKNSSTPIQTFSIGFEEKTFDESSYARKVSSYLGTEHHEMKVTSESIKNILKHFGEILDEPLADPSMVPTYILSKFTSESVTVALAGDGGDELFAGYPMFQADVIARWYQYVPKFINRFLFNTIKVLPVQHTNLSFDFKIKKFLKGFEVSKQYRHQQWLSSFSLAEQSLLCHNVSGTIYEDIDRYLAESLAGSLEQQRDYLYLRTYLMDDILVKVDRTSMRHGLEVRAPFLDTAIVEFANSLPTSFKQKRFITKRILKETMRGKIPDEIINRPKKGFGIPLAQWLLSDLRSFCESVLSREEILKSGLFRYEYVERLKNDHFMKRSNNYKQLWTLMVFQMWYSHWFK